MRRFNEELLKYTADEELLTRIDKLWELNCPAGGTFLHELPPKFLEPFIRVCEQMVASSVSKAELLEYQRLSLDTTKRLGIALDLLSGLAADKRPFSRVAIRGWVASLSVPIASVHAPVDATKVDTTKQRVEVNVEDDYLKGASAFFEDFKEQISAGYDLEELPQQVAIGRLAKGTASLGAALNGMLQYLIESDGECKKVLKEFNQDMARLVPGSAKAAKAAETDREALATEVDRHEQRRLNMELYRTEVLPKLNDMARPFDPIGSMNRSEILVLSACLDVAIAARNRRSKE